MLIVINVLVYIYGLLLGPIGEERFISTYALVPARPFFTPMGHQGSVPAGATLVTSLFLHGGLLHIAGNMLYLWIFGNNVEDSMGRIRFIIFYLLSGIGASYAHAFTNPSSAVPMIGASGAISGILGAYILLFPRTKVITLIFYGLFIRTVEIPAFVVLGFWFVLQFLSAFVLGRSAGGIAWYAHVGGFAIGMMLIGFFKRKNVPFGGKRGYRYS